MNPMLVEPSITIKPSLGSFEPSPFAAPWEAQVFAMVTSLVSSGLFTWSEWSNTLGLEIRPEGAPEQPADYAHWLAALEALLATRGVADGSSVDKRSAAFLRAAAATPHGEPILLTNDPHING